MSNIRTCRDDEQQAILGIINSAADAYRGVIPEDCWHEPYMSESQLLSEIAAGVSFSGYDGGAGLVGVIGLQSVDDVDLIRHAYVLPSHQGKGIGSALLTHVRTSTTRAILIGTWADAEWAIRFYRGHGFQMVSPKRATVLLETYWTITKRQSETSVVLTDTAAYV